MARPMEPLRKKWADRYPTVAARKPNAVNQIFTMRLIEQLESCQSDEARRIILGISELVAESNLPREKGPASHGDGSEMTLERKQAVRDGAAA